MIKNIVIKTDHKNLLVFEIEGDKYTYSSLIVDELWKIKGVKAANSFVPHPLENRVEIRIETDGTITAREALNKAISSLSRIYKAFLKEIS